MGPEPSSDLQVPAWPDWLDASPDGLLILTATGTVLACNRAARQLICAPDWQEHMHPDDAAALSACLDRTIDQPPVTVDLRLHATGRVLEARCQASPHGTLVTLRDATDLRASHGRLQTALAASGTGTWRYDVATGTVTCDANLLAILGLDLDETPVEPQFWLDLVHPDDRAAAVSSVRDGLEDGAELDLPLRVLHPNGGVRWLASKGRALLDGQGQPLEFTGVCVDVTASKRADEALRDSEARFLQGQKLEAIGRMAGGIAHDFNNLLTAVTGYAELALTCLDPETPYLGEYLEEIKRAGERAAGLTAQLLAYSRRQVLAPRVVRLGAVIADMERVLARMLGPHVRFETRFEDASVRVRVDPAQLQQAVTHLVLNARDAMAHGGLLTVTTGLVEAVEPLLQHSAASHGNEVTPGRYAVLVVRDTGQGMAEDVKSHLFEPFYTTKEQGKGTGLGLATVYGIVRQSGGHVQVSSELGRGTEVRVLLPALDALPTGPDADRATATVLIAEDDDLVLQFARDVLGSSGFTVLVSRNGAEALEVASRARIDALLTDVVMAPMDGLELAETLRLQRPGLPVVFMSGHTHDDRAREQAAATGGLFLSKPFSSRDLVQHVRVALQRSP